MQQNDIGVSGRRATARRDRTPGTTMAQQLSLFDLPPRTRNPAPAPATEASGAAPVAQPPPPAGEQPVSDLYGTVYRCYAPLAPGEPVEATLAAALAAFRTRVGA